MQDHQRLRRSAGAKAANISNAGVGLLTWRLSVRVGDLVKYMSRIVLITNFDEEWVYGIELDNDYAEVAKYKHHVLKELISEGR